MDISSKDIKQFIIINLIVLSFAFRRFKKIYLLLSRRQENILLEFQAISISLMSGTDQYLCALHKN